MRRLWAACVGIAISGALLAGTAQASQFRWLRYAPRTILISPNGHPVGGKWQRWIDEARVPTYRGIEVLSVNARRTVRACEIATGCSAPAAPCYFSACGSGHPETWLTPGDTRDDLYYEHGHIVDFEMATNADRAKFIRIWRRTGTVADWWSREETWVTSSVRSVMPLGELWSAAYQLCADGVSDRDSISQAQGVWDAPRWAPVAQRASCILFRSLAHRLR